MAKSLRPEVLLLYGELSHGGIETLIVRIANTFIALGVVCTVVCRGGVLTADFDAAVPLILYETDDEAHYKLQRRKELGNCQETIVITFDPTTCALALWLDATSAFGPCRHLTGIFHPRAYFLDGEDRLRFWINRMVLQTMNDQSVLFMNEDTRRTHSMWSGRTFARSPIAPLGIIRVPPRWRPTRRNRLKVVSVGRLVSFKAYNLGAISITRKLRNLDVDTEWHFYGSGNLEEDMKLRAREANLGSSILFHGDLRYADFAAKVSGHDVFVGMGTAALEAAMLGIPVLLAVDGEEDATYGFVQDVPFGNVGERLAQPPCKSLADLLQDLFQMPPGRQREIGETGRAVALKYDMENYCAQLLKFGLASKRPNRIRGWLVSTLYREVTTGRTRRLARFIWRRWIKPG